MKDRIFGAIKRRRLRSSLAIPNEFLKLQLSRVWELLGSSGPPPDGEGKETQFGFSHGNQIT